MQENSNIRKKRRIRKKGRRRLEGGGEVEERGIGEGVDEEIN